MRHFLYAAAAVAAFATPAVAETIAITGGRLIVGDGSAPVEGGTVVIRDGNVVAAGSGGALSGPRARTARSDRRACRGARRGVCSKAALRPVRKRTKPTRDRLRPSSSSWIASRIRLRRGIAHWHLQRHAHGRGEKGRLDGHQHEGRLEAHLCFRSLNWLFISTAPISTA